MIEIAGIIGFLGVIVLTIVVCLQHVDIKYVKCELDILCRTFAIHKERDSYDIKTILDSLSHREKGEQAITKYLGVKIVRKEAEIVCEKESVENANIFPNALRIFKNESDAKKLFDISVVPRHKDVADAISIANAIMHDAIKKIGRGCSDSCLMCRVEANKKKYKNINPDKWYVSLKRDIIDPNCYDNEPTAMMHAQQYLDDMDNPFCHSVNVFQGVALLEERDGKCSHYLPLVNSTFDKKKPAPTKPSTSGKSR